MTRSTTLIPVSPIRFIGELPSVHVIENRLQMFLRTLRALKQDNNLEAVKLNPHKIPNWRELIEKPDRLKIERRALRYLELLGNKSGTAHLNSDAKAKLAPLRGGLPVSRIETEHEADEIAAALHAEMPWMARATEEVWHGLRASAREGLPGLRFNPLVLVGPPGIGKSHWTRRLAHHLVVPTTTLEATGEPGSFALVGTQKGWGSASPGKLVQTVLSEQHAGPLVIIDEVEKAGEVTSTKGSRHTLTDALLPLLERMTAQAWECPYFQIRFDMSWANWVMTANSRNGLPSPLQSRCVVLDLPGLLPVDEAVLPPSKTEAAPLLGVTPYALDAMIDNRNASPLIRAITDDGPGPTKVRIEKSEIIRFKKDFVTLGDLKKLFSQHHTAVLKRLQQAGVPPVRDPKKLKVYLYRRSEALAVFS